MSPNVMVIALNKKKTSELVTIILMLINESEEYGTEAGIPAVTR